MSADNIKLDKISVVGLFNKYDYDIDFDNDVSVLIAPNGCGKTTIFNLIDATLSPSYKAIMRIHKTPFKKFTCTLSDGSIITLERTQVNNDTMPGFGNKKAAQDEQRRRFLKNKIASKGLNLRFTVYAYYSIEEQNVTDAMNSYPLDYVEELTNVASTSASLYNWLRRQNIEFDDGSFSRSEIEREITALAEKQLELLEQTKCTSPVRFIPTNRINIKAEFSRRDFIADPTSRRLQQVSPVSSAAEKMTERVNDMLSRYNAIKAEVQNNLPRNYLEAKDSDMTYQEFSEKWEEYTDKLKAFYDIGFLDSQYSRIKSITEEDYNKRKLFLETYLNTFSNTFDAFGSDYDRFKAFKKIFDSRNAVTGKKILFTSEGVKIYDTYGFLENTDPRENADIPYVTLSSLSSGEQHDFIMYYTLIFNVDEKSIILVDEPEISLHIEWQESYLDELIDICRNNEFQAIIATHSPHIINGHFDLVKRLKPKK